jgi:hypothetical protein
VDGVTYGTSAPGDSQVGYGVVTFTTATEQPTLSYAFQAGSWASQFSNLPGCADGSIALEVCDPFPWASPETITLTAHPTPEGGYEANPQPPESPQYDSTFVGWGGACAPAGSSPTCTMVVGHTDVIAYFAPGTSGLA